MTDTATDTTASAVDGGTPVGDMEAQAAPPCVNDPANPACARRMIAVDRLTAHPGNVREDLDLTAEFCASVAENGVRVPLLITLDGDGGYRVIEGHRRLAAAVKAGLAEVPYDLDGERAADEAGQYLDMVTANSGAYRKNFTALEEATALFAAHEAGATRTRIRKATGRKADQVKAALAAGGLGMAAREQVGELDRQLTIDELALLAEFEGDPDATDDLMRAISYGYPLEHEAERIRQDRAEEADHQRIKSELEASGCPVTDLLVPGSSLLTSLAHDGEDLTEETHRDCPGHAAFFRSHDRRAPVFYCTDPDAHGHVSRWAQPTPAASEPAGSPAASGDGQPLGTPASGGASGYQADSPAPAPEPEPDPAVEEARRLVAEGNKAWLAAWEVRKRWVRQLLWRRTAPKEPLRFVAQQLLTMPDVLRRGLPAAASQPVFTELTGQPLEAALRDCATYPQARVPLLALAPIAVAYESQIAGDVERNNTWRTDRWAPCSRNDAAAWLTFLAGLGYQMSAIERAVTDGEPYTGDTPGADGDGQAADPGGPAGSSGETGGSPESVGEDADAVAEADGSPEAEQAVA